MKVVILAGGLGTRLRPITDTVPKPMVLLNGRPYLEYQIEYLKRHGFTDILLAVGYLGEKIESHFGDGSRFGVVITYSHERRPLGTGGALKNLEKKLGTADEFLLLYGDSFLPIDLTELAASFLKRGKTCLLVVYGNDEDTRVANNVDVDSDENICAYEKDCVDKDLHFVDSGALCLKRSALDSIPDGVESSLEFDIFPRLIESKEMAAHIADTRFYDIGTPERLKEAESFFRSWNVESNKDI